MSRRSFATAITVIWWVGFMVLLGASNAQSQEICAGDCDGDLIVTVDELVLGVRIGLGDLAVDACQTLDANGDEQVTIDELVRAVSLAIAGCFPSPTPSPQTTPCSPPLAPRVNPLPIQSGDPVVTVSGSVVIESDGTYVYVCAETGCVSTGAFTGHGERSFSLAMLLRMDRVNHLFVCSQADICPACTEIDTQGVPLTVQQVPCLSGTCTPTPGPTPTCANIYYQFCDNGYRGGTCGPCCFCEQTVTPTVTPANAPSKTPTPTPSSTATPLVCTLPGCPDLQPAAAREFLPSPEGGCITDFSEILPYLVNICIANSGDSAAGGFRVETSAPPDFSHPFFAPVFDVSSLDAGAQLCRLVFHPYHDLEVAVDPADEVIESDESNNRRNYPLAIPTVPPTCALTPTPTPTAALATAAEAVMHQVADALCWDQFRVEGTTVFCESAIGHRGNASLVGYATSELATEAFGAKTDQEDESLLRIQSSGSTASPARLRRWAVAFSIGDGCVVAGSSPATPSTTPIFCWPRNRQHPFRSSSMPPQTITSSRTARPAVARLRARRGRRWRQRRGVSSRSYRMYVSPISLRWCDLN